jgi:AcrR family transcriptional regulator
VVETGSGVDREEVGRKQHVLAAALQVFARYGYRKASMEDVARAATISRPGLYLYFASKQDLFCAAVVHALDADIAAAERGLADSDRPLRDRLIVAFDHWTGRYVGPMSRDVGLLIDDNPELLGSISTDYPVRFAKMVADAIAAQASADRQGTAADIAQTLLSTARGIKYESKDRNDFLARFTVSVDLILAALTAPTGPASRITKAHSKTDPQSK